MEKDYKEYIKKLSVYDLADEFNTQTFIVNNDKEFNDILLIDHFKNIDYIDNLETQLKKQKEIIDKTKRIIGEELLAYDNESDEYLVGMKLLQILEDKEV